MSKYRRVPLGELIVDDRYQRPLEDHRVAAMVRNFNEDQLGTLEVSRRNGKVAVFDGQHRLEALRALGVESAPCLVHENLTAQQEADLFVRFQRDRKNIHPVDRFRAQVFSGDEQAKAILAAVEDAGFNIGHAGDGAGIARSIRAVVSLERIYRRGGSDALTGTLRMVDHLWGKDPRSTDGALLEGLHQFFTDYDDCIGDDEIARLQAEAPVTIMRRATGMTGGGTQVRFRVAAELKRIAGVRGRPRKSRVKEPVA